MRTRKEKDLGLLGSAVPGNATGERHAEGHTPLPWMVSSSFIICNAEARIIANCLYMGIPELDLPFEQRVANARLIVTAVNSHQSLIDALRLIADDKCERVTSGGCADHPEWTDEAKYTSDRWCDTCIARRALQRIEDGQ